MEMPGGAGRSFKPDEELVQLLTPAIIEYITKVECKTPQCVTLLEAISQIVNGTIYYVKVLHDGKICHMKILVSLPCDGSKATVLEHKEATDCDALEMF